MPLLIFIFSLVAGLVCLGGFLWSAMDQKPKTIWLLGMGIAIIVGLVGLIFRAG